MNKIAQQISNLIIQRNTSIIKQRNLTNSIRKLQEEMDYLKKQDQLMNYSVQQSRKR